MVFTMTEQQYIDRVLYKKKKEWKKHDPVCVFGLHPLKNSEIQVAHLIRRSEKIEGYSRQELQTMDLNIAPACHDCHDIFDNDPELAVYLPGIHNVLNRIRQIDEMYYNRMMNILNPYWPEFVNCESQIDEGGMMYIQLFCGSM